MHDHPMRDHVAPALSWSAAALLADGRFPSGGHAHSGGYEAASAVFDVDTADGLRRYLRGRLGTSGAADAAIIAGAMSRLRAPEAVDWAELDAEAEARIASPVLRAVSRALGRHWLRAGLRVWPTPALRALESSSPTGPHQAIAFAAVADAAGLHPRIAVVVHLHHMAAAPAAAAVRLHGLDPFEVQRAQAAMGGLIDQIAEQSWAKADAPWEALAAPSGLLTDLLAEEHARWDLRLFQS
ncbi:MAG: urease accessory protein UreF [bacterium]|nr:urease accessory protein UreF [bacterium]